MLQAQSLSYSVDNNPLIEDISLEFTSGVLYGILGPNGSGKTTLLKTLAGIWKPTAGKVLWQGENLHTKDREDIGKTISLVSHNPAVHFEFSVEEIVAMGRYPQNKEYRRSRSSKEIIEWALNTVDAWHLHQRPISRLSSGERQRVYIARALATQSPIILLDEPTASLDISHQLQIWNLLETLADQKKTLIVTLHDLHAAERFCQETTVLRRGRCLAQGPFATIATAQLLSDVFSVVEHPQYNGKTFALPKYNKNP